METKIELLVFSAPWCYGCKVLKKSLDESGIKYVEVNVDEDHSQDLVAKYKVRGLPTTIGLKGDEVVLSALGAGAIQDILELMNKGDGKWQLSWNIL